jgi:hypothetical protein
MLVYQLQFFAGGKWNFHRDVLGTEAKIAALETAFQLYPEYEFRAIRG